MAYVYFGIKYTFSCAHCSLHNRCCDRNSRTEADFKYYLSRELVNHIIYAVI